MLEVRIMKARAVEPCILPGNERSASAVRGNLRNGHAPAGDPVAGRIPSDRRRDTSCDETDVHHRASNMGDRLQAAQKWMDIESRSWK
jgi:hypothetical protein